MSYDLYLRKRDGLFDDRIVLDWFRARLGYRVENRQAIYGSADTGVYFTFSLNSDPADNYDVHFELNYFRPSTFVLEAEPEVTDLVQTFDFIVTDPQIEGMGEDSYTGPGFVAAWTRSLEKTLPEFLREPSARRNLLTLPTARLMEIWHWNRERKALQHSVGDHLFVPRIFFLRVREELAIAIVWTDGIPMILPAVDLVFIHRQELAPWRLLGRRPNQAIAPWNEVMTLVAPYSAMHTSGALKLAYDRPPKALVDRLKALPTMSLKPDPISVDAILDREMVQRALAVRQ